MLWELSLGCSNCRDRIPSCSTLATNILNYFIRAACLPNNFRFSSSCLRCTTEIRKRRSPRCVLTPETFELRYGRCFPLMFAVSISNATSASISFKARRTSGSARRSSEQLRTISSNIGVVQLLKSLATSSARSFRRSNRDTCSASSQAMKSSR